MRPLENRDLVRHGESVAHAALGQRATLIKAQQARFRGLGFDDENDINHPLAEAGSDGGQGPLHQQVELAPGQSHDSIVLEHDT